jgi:hypothetical protein
MRPKSSHAPRFRCHSPLRAPALAPAWAWAAVLIGALSVIPTAPTWAADGPVISGPEKSPAFKQVRLSLQGDADDVDWVVFPIGKADGERFGDKGASYTFTGPPGEYQVLVTLVKANKLSHATKVVVIGEPGPVPIPVPPGPSPGPNPNPTPNPTPVPPQPETPFQAVIRSYVTGSRLAYADAWDAAAGALESGQTVSQAMDVLGKTLGTKRSASFESTIKPQLVSLLPEGAEPTDAAKRAQVVAFWRSIAAAIRGVK